MVSLFDGNGNESVSMGVTGYFNGNSRLKYQYLPVPQHRADFIRIMLFGGRNKKVDILFVHDDVRAAHHRIGLSGFKPGEFFFL